MSTVTLFLVNAEAFGHKYTEVFIQEDYDAACKFAYDNDGTIVPTTYTTHLPPEVLRDLVQEALS